MNSDDIMLNRFVSNDTLINVIYFIIKSFILIFIMLRKIMLLYQTKTLAYNSLKAYFSSIKSKKSKRGRLVKMFI